MTQPLRRSPTLAHFQQKRGHAFVPENALNQKFRPLSDGKPVPTFLESGLDRRGAAAAEFALLLPLLMLLMTGMVEIGLRLQTNGAVVRSSMLTSDLVAQSAQLTSAQLDDMTAATRAMLELAPSDPADLVIDVVSIGYAQSDGAPRILWRRTMGGPPLALDLAAAEALGAPGESVIWVGVAYDYDLPFSFSLPGEARFEHGTFARPRLTRMIGMDGQTEEPQ